MKINTIKGPWMSLGIHIDFKHRHVDLHIIWWVIVIGNTIEPIYCGYCGVELPEGSEKCPKCDNGPSLRKQLIISKLGDFNPDWSPDVMVKWFEMMSRVFDLAEGEKQKAVE